MLEGLASKPCANIAPRGVASTLQTSNPHNFRTQSPSRPLPSLLDPSTLGMENEKLIHVKMTQVDFEEDMMRSAFAVLNNPVSESACGCGSSFALKNFEKNPALD